MWSHLLCISILYLPTLDAGMKAMQAADSLVPKFLLIQVKQHCMGSSYVMTTDLAGTVFGGWCCRWTHRLCLLSSDGMLAVGKLSMFVAWISVFFDGSLCQVEVEHYSITMLWLLFHVQIMVTWNAKYARIYASIPGDELVLAFAVSCSSLCGVWSLTPTLVLAFVPRIMPDSGDLSCTAIWTDYCSTLNSDLTNKSGRGQEVNQSHN